MRSTLLTTLIGFVLLTLISTALGRLNRNVETPDVSLKHIARRSVRHYYPYGPSRFRVTDATPFVRPFPGESASTSVSKDNDPLSKIIPSTIAKKPITRVRSYDPEQEEYEDEERDEEEIDENETGR
ncbi:MAG: hypothetical protein EXX96DRAFT_298961 [Benjaminiella poitrasii]|nr:MAG: hypothetical protein EXX96DRAFT_298961 [Benjaminiella poitrasii]